MDDICEALEEEIIKSDKDDDIKKDLLKKLCKFGATKTNIMLVGATGCGKCSTINFDKSNLTPHKIQSRTSFNMSDVDYGSGIRLKSSKDFKLYSPEETVARALSRLGEDKYSLVLNNCEHFAIWCKT